MWISLVLVFCLALGAQSSNLKEYQDEVPGHEGQCVSKSGKFYKLGEAMVDDQEPCTRKVCKGTAAPGSVYIEVQSCSKVKEQPGCTLKSDPKQSFPDCCGKLECKHH